VGATLQRALLVSLFLSVIIVGVWLPFPTIARYTLADTESTVEDTNTFIVNSILGLPAFLMYFALQGYLNGQVLGAVYEQVEFRQWCQWHTLDWLPVPY
jgi:Na+-driven multidrug efflux pump